MVLGVGQNTEDRFWKVRAATYHAPIDDKKAEKRDTNPVLDDVINAEVRGIGCRRKPFRVYFENDKLHGVAHENNLSDICTNHNNIQSPEPGREWKIREVR